MGDYRMDKTLIYVIFFVIVLFDQSVLLEGEYVRCYVKECLEGSVFKLTKEKIVLHNTYMEGRKSREKKIGTWSSIDSTIYFEFTNDYEDILDKSYKLKQWKDYNFLVAEKEILQWNVMIDKINEEFANDENLKFLNGGKWHEDELSQMKKREIYRYWEIFAIQNAITDHDILIKRK